MKCALRVESLYYKDILEDVSFDIEEGKITAIIGKNSSGKTSLLRCISKLNKYKGYVHNNIANNVGLYLESNVLLFKDVYSNIEISLNKKGISKKKLKEKVYEYLRKFDIDFLIYEKVSNLSYSNQKIIKILQVLLSDNKIIFIDDLYEGLNTKEIDSFFKLFKELDKTIIYTTKDSNNIIKSNNVIVLNDGKVVAFGKTKEVIKEESIFIKNGLNLPFIIDLSSKLKLYGVVEQITSDCSKLVNDIWK